MLQSPGMEVSDTHHLSTARPYQVAHNKSAWRAQTCRHTNICPQGEHSKHTPSPGWHVFLLLLLLGMEGEGQQAACSLLIRSDTLTTESCCTKSWGSSEVSVCDSLHCLACELQICKQSVVVVDVFCKMRVCARFHVGAPATGKLLSA